MHTNADGGGESRSGKKIGNALQLGWVQPPARTTICANSEFTVAKYHFDLTYDRWRRETSMTPNCLAATAFRYSIFAVFALSLFAPNAQAQNATTAINGVYNGTYTCALGPRTLKLSLLASGNGSLTGVFTFYLPPTSHTQAFSYSLNGTFDAASGKFKLNPVKWENPPPGSYSMVGMDGAFDPGTGQVAGKITFGNCGAFQAARDKSESPESIATLLVPPPAVPESTKSTLRTPQSNAAGASATVATAPAPMPAAPPPESVAPSKRPCDFMTKSDAEDILGTAVVARENTVFYCSFVETGFTSKVPTNHQVNMSVWYSTSPDPSQYAVLLKNIADHRNPVAVMKEITDFADAAIWIWTEGWGGILDAFNGGTIHVEVTISGLPQYAALQNAKALAARVLGRTGGTGYVYLGTPKRNASASALQPASLAVPPSKATVAGSLPAATKGTIHKSKAYWDGYRSAIIRQVFEGNFGHERLDSSTQFRLLFNSYVESFSKSCHAYLPARHEAVTLSQATTKSDRTGNVVSQQELQSWTVEADSRFAPEYREYAGSLFSTSGETLAGALAIMSGKVSPTAFFDPGTDVIKFFETETCQSAAMRQLSENLLRAAEGRSPLQDAGDHNP